MVTAIALFAVCVLLPRARLTTLDDVAVMPKRNMPKPVDDHYRGQEPEQAKAREDGLVHFWTRA